MNATNSAGVTSITPRQLPRLQTRYKLVLYGGLAILLALLVIAQASSAYRTAYNLFQGIAVVNSTKVDAAEEALQRLASTSQATADYTALSSDTPLFEQAQNNIFRNFQAYRDQMFILQSNLQTPEEQSAFTVADTYTYSRFWRHVGNLMAQRSDLTAATREYLFADAQLRDRIIPALQDLEALNFQAMVDAGQQAGAAINLQVAVLGVLAGALALGLSAFSLWVRRRVRRYLTPGIDIAVVLVWLAFIIMIPNLLALPGQITTITNDAYFTISGASRALVDANQANRAESSAIIDNSRKADWYQQFDDEMQLVELYLCGVPGCAQQPFMSAGGFANSQMVSAAQHMSAADAQRINNIEPLLAKISFEGELPALESARQAYLKFMAVDTQLRQKIDAGDSAGAVTLNTGTEAGSSEEAFGQLVSAMNDVRQINREVFNNIWNDQRESLPRNETLYGVVAYLAVIGLVLVGVYHRYREL